MSEIEYMEIDGIEAVVSETYHEPEHASVLDNTATFTYRGQSATFQLRGIAPAIFAMSQFVIVLVEKGTNNHYRLVCAETDKLAYHFTEPPSCGLKEALAWKGRFLDGDELRELRSKYDFLSIMKLDDISREWMKSFMPLKRSNISKAMREAVYAKYDGHCAYCGKAMDITEMQVDHVESHYRHQGKDELDNYLPACRDCNGLKSDYLLEEFRTVLIPKCARANPNDNTRAGRICKAYGLKWKKGRKIIFYFEKNKAE